MVELSHGLPQKLLIFFDMISLDGNSVSHESPLMITLKCSIADTTSGSRLLLQLIRLVEYIIWGVALFVFLHVSFQVHKEKEMNLLF